MPVSQELIDAAAQVQYTELQHRLAVDAETKAAKARDAAIDARVTAAKDLLAARDHFNSVVNKLNDAECIGITLKQQKAPPLEINRLADGTPVIGKR